MYTHKYYIIYVTAGVKTMLTHCFIRGYTKIVFLPDKGGANNIYPSYAQEPHKTGRTTLSR